MKSVLILLLIVSYFCSACCFTLGFRPPLIIKGTKLKMLFEWDLNRKTAEDKMKRTVDSISNKFGNVRATGANPSMLEKVVVPGVSKTQTLLGSISKIFVSGANTLIVEPTDKSILSIIEKAILKLEMDYTAFNDGTVVKVGVPPLTEDRRHELVKHAKMILEEGKVSLRNTRREFLDLVRNAEKGKIIGKDTSKTNQVCNFRGALSYLSYVSERVDKTLR